MGEIAERILERAKKGRNKIGIGILSDSQELLEHFEKASKYCDIVTFGKKIGNYENITTDLSEEGTAKAVIQAYKNHKIQGFIRGHLKFDPFSHEIKLAFGKKYSKDIAAIMKNLDGTEYLIGPAVMSEGYSVDEKLDFCLRLAEHFKRWKLMPKFGILGGDFYEDRGYNQEVDKTIENGMLLTKKLKEKGFQAKYHAHLIDRAIDESNVVVPINGIYGNFFYRLLLYCGGAEELGEIVLCDENYTENSRYTDRFSNHLIFTNALVNLNKERKNR